MNYFFFRGEAFGLFAEDFGAVLGFGVLSLGAAGCCRREQISYSI